MLSQQFLNEQGSLLRRLHPALAAVLVLVIALPPLQVTYRVKSWQNQSEATSTIEIEVEKGQSLLSTVLDTALSSESLTRRHPLSFSEKSD